MNILLQLSIICLLGAMSPGPDFFLVTRYSINNGRSIALWATLGITLGAAIHCLIAVTGTEFLQKSHLWGPMKIIAAAYLFFLASKLFMNFFKTKSTSIDESLKNSPFKYCCKWKALSVGFISNVLNPKAILFFMGVYAPIIAKENITTSTVLAIVTGTAFTWFALLSHILGSPKLGAKLKNSLRYFELAFAACLFYFSMNLMIQ